MFRKFLASGLAIVMAATSVMPSAYAVPTDGLASPWTRAKAEQLARKALLSPTPAMIDQLANAPSASAAVDILFPSQGGPDRTAFDAEMAALTSTNFDWGNGGHMAKYYQYRYARDPYEAKAKFFALLEDIFAVNANGSSITYRDVKELHDLLYAESFGSYKNLVKKVLFNGVSGDYAASKFLDLLDATDKRYPNENYARELLQLFLMGEYEPGKSKDNGDTRNYEESDVAALAKILTGFRSDSTTHRVSYDVAYHNTATGVLFLSGASSLSFPFYDSASGTLNLGMMDVPAMGNNGLTDNTIDYIFAKRDRQVAYFLADRIFRFYVHDTPTRNDLENIVDSIVSNGFELFPVVKSLLASNALYSEKAMNSVTYKNPLELAIGTAKILHASTPTDTDPMLADTGLLSRLNWSTYTPGSIFGRDGFDSNAKWYSTYIQDQWISYANTIAYRTGTGSYDPLSFFPNTVVSLSGSVSVATSSGNTYSGTVRVLSGTVTATDYSGSIAPSDISLILPNFSLSLDGKPLKIDAGTLNLDTHTISVTAGTYTDSGTTYAVTSATFTLDGTEVLRRELTAQEVITSLENALLLGRRLPSTVTDRIATFLTTSEAGATIPVKLSDAAYVNKKIRGAVALVLMQPEYVLQTGFDAATDAPSGATSPLTGATGKLLFVELGGGYDWLHGVVPKNEYADYVAKRTVGTGTIAIDLPRMTDLADSGYYLNNAIAYGSGGAPSFKSLYDSGNLRIFNRVGTDKHSRDHDAAAKQIASSSSTTVAGADGVFGHMIKQHLEDIDTISLTGRLPNVFRGGKYVNIGPSGAIFSHPRGSNSAEGIAQLTAVREIFQSRSYPGATSGLFKGAVKVDDVASRSKQAGGPDGAGWGNANNLAFLRTLLSNSTGKTFYMQADGGYDTHSNQLAPQSNFDPNNVPKDLNYNIGRVAENLTKFFNDVKGTQDITIVVFSEFGRTIASNGDLGTDHGEAGGMFVLSNNQAFLSSVPQKVSGNLSFAHAKDNWLGVGIDYRAVYGKIFRSLYALDPVAYFGKDIKLEDEIAVTTPRFVLSRREFRAQGSSVFMKLPFKVEGTNYDTDYASYVDIETGTGMESLKPVNRWTLEYNYKKPDGSYVYTGDWLTQGRPFAFRATAYDDQYSSVAYTGTFTYPKVIPTTGSGANTVSRTSDSILSGYSNLAVTGTLPLAGTGIILSNNGTGTTSRIVANDGVAIETGTGLTAVTSLVATSGTITYNGGYILGESVPLNAFVPSTATITGSGAFPLDRMRKLVKVGADMLGIGMRLNQSVTLEVGGLPVSSTLDVVSSEDGATWAKVGSGTVAIDASGTARFGTDHFSYFAFLSQSAGGGTGTGSTGGGTGTGSTGTGSTGGGTWTGSTWTGSTGTGTTGGGTGGGSTGGGSTGGGSTGGGSSPIVYSGGGGGVSTVDHCPNGDTSPSYHDGLCSVNGTPTTTIVNLPIVVSRPIGSPVIAPVISVSKPLPKVGSVAFSTLFSQPAIATYQFSMAQTALPFSVQAELNAFANKVKLAVVRKTGADIEGKSRYYDAIGRYLEQRSMVSSNPRDVRVFAYLAKKFPHGTQLIGTPVAKVPAASVVVAPVMVPQTGSNQMAIAPIIPMPVSVLPKYAFDFGRPEFSGFDYDSDRRLPRSVQNAVKSLAASILEDNLAKSMGSDAWLRSNAATLAALDRSIASAPNSKIRKLTQSIRNEVYLQNELKLRGSVSK